MGTTFRFLATVDGGLVVRDWFRNLDERPVESPHPAGAVFYFRQCGSLLPEPHRSPVVNVYLPRRRRGVLTTVGEVHFLATPISVFPELARVKKKFREWMRQNPIVFSRRTNSSQEYDHYLEGSIRNQDTDVFALPSGLASLRSGDYFVSEDDNSHVLDLVCRKLQLRGVAGLEKA